MIVPKHINYKDNIKEGDLIIWSSINSGKWFDFGYANLIRLFTMSEYYHVAIVYDVTDKYILTIDAQYPKTKLLNLSDRLPVYHIAMDVTMTDKLKARLSRKINVRYSLYEAVLAYFGVFLDNGKWLCTELVTSFYYHALDIDLLKYTTPSKVVKQILALPGKKLTRLV